MQPAVKADLREIWQAETRAAAETAIDTFAEKYGAKYEKAVTCLTKDREALLAFYGFPRRSLGSPAHRQSDRERVRHRQASNRADQGSIVAEDREAHGLQARFRAAAKTWRRLKGAKQLPMVIEGCQIHQRCRRKRYRKPRRLIRPYHPKSRIAHACNVTHTSFRHRDLAALDALLLPSRTGICFCTMPGRPFLMAGRQPLSCGIAPAATMSRSSMTKKVFFWKVVGLGDIPNKRRGRHALPIESGMFAKLLSHCRHRPVTTGSRGYDHERRVCGFHRQRARALSSLPFDISLWRISGGIGSSSSPRIRRARPGRPGASPAPSPAHTHPRGQKSRPASAASFCRFRALSPSGADGALNSRSSIPFHVRCVNL